MATIAIAAASDARGMDGAVAWGGGMSATIVCGHQPERLLLAGTTPDPGFWKASSNLPHREQVCSRLRERKYEPGARLLPAKGGRVRRRRAGRAVRRRSIPDGRR